MCIIKKLFWIFILIFLFVMIWYWLIPVKVHYEYIGSINVDKSMNDFGYVPCRDYSDFHQGFDYFLHYPAYILSPVNWDGVARYQRGQNIRNDEEPFYFFDLNEQICFQSFLEEYLKKNNKKELNYFISWGRPIEKIWYQRKSKLGEDRVNYIGVAVFSDIITKPEVFVYKMIDIVDVQPIYDDENSDSRSCMIRFKDGIFTDYMTYPYQIFLDELKETWSDYKEHEY